MTLESGKAPARVDQSGGRPLDAHYVGFFERFNRQRYFEAHEILEQLWLPARSSPNGLFYKGLIQLAGAFVHVQKNRPGPALALLALAEANLARYPGTHESLNVDAALNLIRTWLHSLRSTQSETIFLRVEPAPKLEFQVGTGE
jgi:predicted metal-dependent hydrolase